MRISTLEAATRQLNLAIQMLFSNADPVAVHTLIGAASVIFSNLVEKVDLNKSWDKKAQEANALSPRQYFEIMRKAQNFFKHTDGDPEAIIEFDPIDTKSLAFWTVMNASEISSLSIEAQVFQLWYIASHSPIQNVEESPLKEAIELVGDLRSVARTERLKIGDRVLQMALARLQ